jgi:hypothetical protein
MGQFELAASTPILSKPTGTRSRKLALIVKSGVENYFNPFWVVCANVNPYDGFISVIDSRAVSLWVLCPDFNGRRHIVLFQEVVKRPESLFSRFVERRQPSLQE